MKHNPFFTALLYALAYVAYGSEIASAQQPMITHQDMNADDELAFNLRKHFRYRHNLYEVDSVVTDYFFSLRMAIDSSGLIASVRHSVGMDTALFGKSYRDFSHNVPKDIFKKYGLRDVSVLMPVFIILRPNEKDRFDFGRNAIYIARIWEFEDDGSHPVPNTLLYRPLSLQHGFHGRMIIDRFTDSEERKFVNPEHKKALERNRTKLDKIK